MEITLIKIIFCIEFVTEDAGQDVAVSRCFQETKFRVAEY
jgi:hypothetical protein